MVKLLVALFSFTWLLITSNQVSRFFQKIKLPLITGFLLSGILIGPPLFKWSIKLVGEKVSKEAL